MTAAGWPPAVTLRNEGGRSPFVLLCEHASRHIPVEYNNLGLPEAEVRRHIGWDIGAAEVAARLSDLLDAPLFLAGYSRLLIDLNRPLHSAGLIPARSEATDIPGNLNLDPAERKRRIEHIFAPFHDRVAAMLEHRLARGVPTILVTVHSFTPVYLGEARPWHAGILFDRSAAFATRLIDRLSREPGLVVAGNQPYRITMDEDYAIPRHGQDRGLDAVLIEIRNDRIATPEGAQQWAERLARALAPEVGGGSAPP
ncbi:N-formylglutamate amidohydrolase [Zavarzinia aquatilis]|uniref:N-formylglutamate amidohydrolase n=1 Tax=Zavarzinia aquatilis TaxID=2211142 RepID=UPI001A9C55EC|nr:N-formylglutamate amidohydrolase [Zavarzinia aquatilis]